VLKHTHLNEIQLSGNVPLYLDYDIVNIEQTNFRKRIEATSGNGNPIYKNIETDQFCLLFSTKCTGLQMLRRTLVDTHISKFLTANMAQEQTVNPQSSVDIRGLRPSQDN